MVQVKKLMKLHRLNGEEILVHPDIVGIVEKSEEYQDRTIIYPSVKDWENNHYGIAVKETPEEVANIFMSCNW